MIIIIVTDMYLLWIINFMYQKVFANYSTVFIATVLLKLWFQFHLSLGVGNILATLYYWVRTQGHTLEDYVRAMFAEYSDK